MRHTSRRFTHILSIAVAIIAVALMVNPVLAASNYTWANVTSSTAISGQQWHGAASSTSGKYLVTMAVSGDIYTSTDYGATWANRTASTLLSGLHWESVASSSSGQYLVAAAYNDDIYTSADYGVTWVRHSVAGPQGWSSVTVSGSGQYVYASSGDGNIYTSADYGATWTNRIAPGSAMSRSLATSSNGQYLVAMEVNGDIYTSADYGATWTNRTASTPLSGLQWMRAVSSSSGQNVAVITTDRVYTSTDYGATWTYQTAAGSSNWNALASSATGQSLAAAAATGHIFTSADYGVTWTDQTSAGNQYWQSIAMSASGQRIFATADGQDIYTANDPTLAPPAPSVSARTASSSVNASVVVDLLGGVGGDPDSATFQIISGPTHGTVGSVLGVVTYVPNAGYIGTDSLTYQVCATLDPSVCATAVLELNVNPSVPSAPNTGYRAPSGHSPIAAVVIVGATIAIGVVLSILFRRIRAKV